jgi:hypothetical protein
MGGRLSPFDTFKAIGKITGADKYPAVRPASNQLYKAEIYADRRCNRCAANP